MRSVSVIGAAMTRFGRYRDSTLAEIARPSVVAALADAGVGLRDVQEAYCGTALGGMLSGQRVFRDVGLTGIPVYNVENACSSSASAFRLAWLSIASGACDTALVVGVEKLTKFGGGTLPLEQEDHEVLAGMTMPALYAMRARRYLHEHGVTREDLARVAVKSKRHGALNPYAQYRTPVTVEEVLASRPVAEPLRLLDCCPTGDGAAALVLTATERVPRLGARAVRVVASELTSGRYLPGYRDMTVPEITVRGAALAWEMAGLGPSDVDVAEVHDAFTIAELMYCEAFGFCAPGDAMKLLDDGETSLAGRIPVNPSGGLLSRGHPVGATGAAQLVEIVWQLRGDAGDRQVEGAKVGLAHATGGGIAGVDHGACSIHVLAR